MIKKEDKFEKAKDIILSNHICLGLEEDDWDIIVTVPVLADESVFELVESLNKSARGDKKICVFILINEPEGVDEKTEAKNLSIYRELREGSKENIFISVKYVSRIPRKVAGVGFARKLLMDETICAFERISKRKKEKDKLDFFHQKIITSLDSDCVVSENYFDCLDELQDFGVYLFSHRFSKDQLVRKAGIIWELFLRYWRNSLRLCGYDFAFYPIGSLFAFRSDVYVITGGMNIRKGGEDFYFMQKVVPYFSVSDLRAYVFPKAEPSERTPFGTGKEIKLYISGITDRIEKTWRFEVFGEIGRIFADPESSSFFKDFIKENPKYARQIENIKKSGGDFNARFRLWFNNFKVFKLLRFSEKVLGRSYLHVEAQKLISKISGQSFTYTDYEAMNNILKLYDENVLHKISPNLNRKI